MSDESKSPTKLCLFLMHAAEGQGPREATSKRILELMPSTELRIGASPTNELRVESFPPRLVALRVDEVRQIVAQNRQSQAELQIFRIGRTEPSTSIPPQGSYPLSRGSYLACPGDFRLFPYPIPAHLDPQHPGVWAQVHKRVFGAPEASGSSDGNRSEDSTSSVPGARVVPDSPGLSGKVEASTLPQVKTQAVEPTEEGRRVDEASPHTAPAAATAQARPMSGQSRLPLSPGTPPPPSYPPPRLTPCNPPEAPRPLVLERNDEPGLYLTMLPEIYHDQDFLRRFLQIPQSYWEPCEWRQDHLPLYFDAETCPAEMLRWLASWFGVEEPELETERALRMLVRNAQRLACQRGTLEGLTLMLELHLGTPPRLQSLGEETYAFAVQIRRSLLPTEPTEFANRIVKLEKVIRRHKPAFMAYTLSIEEG